MYLFLLCRTKRSVEQFMFCLADHSQELLPGISRLQSQCALGIQSGHKLSLEPKHKAWDIAVAESDRGARKALGEVSQLWWQPAFQELNEL